MTQDPMAEIRASFFVECDELLESLADGLGALERGEGDAETINTVFRAVHSIKGGAGAFGLSALVAFAHRFESVLDAIRGGRLSLDAAGIRLLFAAADILGDEVAAARDDSPEPAGAEDALRAIEALLGDAPATEAPEPEAGFQPLMLSFDFDVETDEPTGPEEEERGYDDPLPELNATTPEPWAAPDAAPGPAAHPAGAADAISASAWELWFRPHAGLYDSGNEPLHLLRALRRLGADPVVCDISALPALDGLAPGGACLGWRLWLDDTVPEEAIREVFDFVEDVSTIEISRRARPPCTPEPASFTPPAARGASPPLPTAPDPGTAAAAQSLPASGTAAEMAPGPAPSASAAPPAATAAASASDALPAALTGAVVPILMGPADFGTVPAEQAGARLAGTGQAGNGQAGNEQAGLGQTGIGREQPRQAEAGQTETGQAGAAQAARAAPAGPPGPAGGATPAPAPATAGGAEAPGPSADPALATVRVDIGRLDRLVNLVGELVVNQAMLSQSVAAAGLPSNSPVMSGLESFMTLTRDIQDSMMMIRAQPVKPLFQRMARIVREASAAVGKEVRLRTEGDATEVDRTVIERLADPLTHMIRNAVDHGLETPEARRAAGKPAEGLITLSAQHRSGRVVIEIADDGAGIDRQRVQAIATARGLVPAGAALSDGEIDNLLFLPGFSTASKVSNLSGRGVGMDVVRAAIRSLGGRISISSEPGRGSTFSISLPLTLAVLDGMVVEVAGETLVVPLSAILETTTLARSEIRAFAPGRHVIHLRGGFVPLYDLGEALGYREPGSRATAAVVLLTAQDDGSRAALIVDTILDQRQVVIKGLEQSYGPSPGIAAATILGNGQVALILDPADLVGHQAELGRGHRLACAG